MSTQTRAPFKTQRRGTQLNQAIMASSSSPFSKPTNLNQKLFITSLLLLSFSLFLLVLSFKPKLPQLSYHQRTLEDEEQPNGNQSINLRPRWLDTVMKTHVKGKKIKVAVVDVDDHRSIVNGGSESDHQRDVFNAGVEAVHVRFDRVGEDAKWEDFFPEWIDEDQKWGPPKCPEIPMPAEEYRDFDVVVARAPCGDGDGGRKGVRDVLRLQVNLVVANLAVRRGRGDDDVDRTVYVVFVGSCGAMAEMFRCDDLVEHAAGDYWVYKPELRRLRQKASMPVGSCQIAAAPSTQTGEEKYHQREAYVTVLHSSEIYVCGAIALAQSIVQRNTSKDLVLLHDDSLSAKSLRGLRAAGWKTKRISRIRSPFAKKDSYNEWNYSKLRVWQLIEYDKLIFIDSDLLVLENIDDVFFYPELSAAGNDKVLFNSGVMVIEPSLCKFHDLIRKSFKVSSYNGGDQGFLNEVFTWWHRLPKRVNHLKMFTKKEGEEEHLVGEDVSAIHYLGLKPWLCYRDYDCNYDMRDRVGFASDSAHKKWWRVHDAMPQELQQHCALTKHMDNRIKKWRRIAESENLANGRWKIKPIDPRQHQIVDQ